MKCNEFEVHLNAVLDERRSPESDPALVSHARACAACGELLTTTGELLTGVRGLSIPELDGTMSQRVRDELNRETVTVGPRYGLAVAAVMTIAAALLLAAFLLPGSPENLLPDSPKGDVAVEQGTAPAEVEVAMADPVSLDRDMLLKLIQDTRNNVDKIPSLLTGSSSPTQSTQDTHPNSDHDGLEEMTESVVGSFGFLLDVLEEADRQPNS